MRALSRIDEAQRVDEVSSTDDEKAAVNGFGNQPPGTTNLGQSQFA